MNEFNQVMGYEPIKEELYRIIDCLNNIDKYNKLGAKSPKGLLLYGDPGLGKTLIANCFINSINRKKYVIRKDKPNGEFVKYLTNEIKDAIQNEPSIVLLDDLDKYSNNDDKHKNSDEFIALQSMIDDSKNKEIFFIATANDLSSIPGSLLRKGRFDYEIGFSKPNTSDSKKIISYYLKNKINSNDVDIDELANILAGSSCAELEEFVNEAGIYAGYHNHKEVTMDDYIDAALRTIFDSPKENIDRNPYQLKIAAYHEAGHTIISELLSPKSVNLVCISNYFNGNGGVTSVNKDENIDWDKDIMLNNAKVCLAGKAAIELKFNKLDVGSEQDIKTARDIISELEDYCCNHDFIKNYDGTPLDRINIIKNEELRNCYLEVKQLLFENMDKLDAIANLLIEKKVIRQKDVNNILRGQA